MPFPPLNSIPKVDPNTSTEVVNDTAITISEFGWEGFACLVLVATAGFTLSLLDAENWKVKRILAFLYPIMIIGALGSLSSYGPRMMMVSAVIFSVAWVIGLNVFTFWNLDLPRSLSPSNTSNLDDAQIKRVVGMVQQGKCDEHMRQKLLDLATSALPKLIERIKAHRTAIEQIRPLRERLPTNEAIWNLAQQTVNERFQRLVGRLTRLEELEVACRQQLDALEAIMLDDALTASISGTLDAEHAQLMAAINDALDDARQQTYAHDEVDGLAHNDTIDLERRRRAAAAKARTPDGH